MTMPECTHAVRGAAAAAAFAFTRALCCFAADAPLFNVPFALDGGADGKARVTGAPMTLEPGGRYALRFSARRAEEGAGIFLSGTDRVNVDWYISNAVPEERLSVFRSQTDRVRADRFRFGGWNLSGKIEVDSVSVRPVKVRWGSSCGFSLGHGEELSGNRYSFETRFGGTARNDSRPLVSFDADFNTQRWRVSGRQHVEYRHSLDGRRFVSGEVSLKCSNYHGGAAAVEVSRDGAEWMRLGSVTNAGDFAFSVPARVFPADALSVRIAGGDGCYVQISRYAFAGAFDGSPVNACGSTRYEDAETGATVAEMKACSYFDESYGERVGEKDGVVFWRAASDRKIHPGRKVPSAKAEGLHVKTAANESEAVQLVVTPESKLENVRVSVAGDLLCGSESLSAKAVDVRRVGYVNIVQPTDSAGCRGLWPDPLFPQEPDGCSIGAGCSQPFRIRVKVPKGARKGVYRGTVKVESSAGTAEIPLAVEVFGFVLPDVMTCETAFGFSMSQAVLYHKPKTPEERKLLFGKYMRLMADNHISPYYPAEEAKWRVWWRGLKENPRTAEPVFDWSAWDAAMEKAFGEYRFNTAKLRVQGLGDGDFHSHWPPEYLGYSCTNEIYDVLMAKYLGGIEKHLREKGWLDKTYVYWFDEPEEKDYDYVMRGFATLKKHAPGLRRMLTEEIHPRLVGGPDLWCASTSRFHAGDPAATEACRAAGDRFWWYLCTGPKAPYVTLFIDHPGVEMRMWSWQTWKEKIHGLLIWETSYWTSAAAYPDAVQNPYEDPMSWQNGYSTAKGRRIPWGNGDGRLFYPPLSAADGKAVKTVFDDPVPSFRLEMLSDGIEDYEYLSMLKRRLEKGAPEERAKFGPLLEVPADVTSSMTSFAQDAGTIEKRRLEIARALEELR